MHTDIMNQLEPTILLENEHLMVIDKPSGLLVHPDGKREEYSLVDWILKNRPKMAGVGEPLKMEYKGEQIVIDRPGIVHRLDRETSGVMILAKDQKTYEHLKLQFQDHSIRKEYVAIVLGYVEPRGVVNTPIGRNARDIRIWTAGRGARGVLRDAVTRYVIQKKLIDKAGNKYSVVSLFPETGRTHQLRVHMKFTQHPIIGDGLYAPKTVGMLGFNRVALHARKITFKDIDNKECTIEAELPEDFKKILNP